MDDDLRQHIRQGDLDALLDPRLPHLLAVLLDLASRVWGRRLLGPTPIPDDLAAALGVLGYPVQDMPSGASPTRHELPAGTRRARGHPGGVKRRDGSA